MKFDSTIFFKKAKEALVELKESSEAERKISDAILYGSVAATISIVLIIAMGLLVSTKFLYLLLVLPITCFLAAILIMRWPKIKHDRRIQNLKFAQEILAEEQKIISMKNKLTENHVAPEARAEAPFSLPNHPSPRQIELDPKIDEQKIELGPS